MKAFVTSRILGVGEPLATDEATDAFDLLNGILEQANLDKLLSYYETEIVFPLTANKLSYTIGPASAAPDVTAVRPVEILSAFSRRNGIDLPVRVSHQKADYDQIRMKALTVSGWEDFVYYQASFPSGVCYFYMQPNDGLTGVHLTVKADLTSFASLDDTVSMPPGYRTWLQYKLAQRLSPEHGLTFPDALQSILVETEAALQRNNVKPLPIISSGLAGISSTSGGYNVYADTTRGN